MLYRVVTWIKVYEKFIQGGETPINRLIQDTLLVLWIGGLWVVGYMVVPVLFQTLDKVVAGELAGVLFVKLYYMGIITSLLLIALMEVARRKNKSAIPAASLLSKPLLIVYGLLLAMLGVSLLELFIIHPRVVEIKQAMVEGSVAMDVGKSRFGMLHGIGSLLYLVMSMMGLALFYVRASVLNASATFLPAEANSKENI